MKKGKKLLVLGLVLTYMCLATACTRNNNGNDSGTMAGTETQNETNNNGMNNNNSNVTGTTDTQMGNTSDIGDTATDDGMLDNTGNAIGDAVDDAGNTIGNIVDDAANGVSDITDDLVGGDNHNNSTTSTTGNGTR